MFKLLVDTIFMNIKRREKEKQCHGTKFLSTLVSTERCLVDTLLLILQQ